MEREAVGKEAKKLGAGKKLFFFPAPSFISKYYTVIAGKKRAPQG